MANNSSTLVVPGSTPVSMAAKKGRGKPTSVRKAPVPARQKSKADFVNMSQMLAAPPMQISEAGVPYRYIVPPADPTEDPGYLRPPTRQDIEYGERLQKAQKQKETGVYPTGWDPVLSEQRITAAERQPHGAGWKGHIIDPLRKEQYGPSASQNVGDFLKGAYSNTLGGMVPFAYGPGGAIYNAQWSHRPNLALPMRRENILRGEGTIADKSRVDRRREAEYRHKYYGTPKPEPRAQNVYDELGMSQPIRGIPSYDVGQRDVPTYLTDMGKRAELELGPAKVLPPGSDWGLPAGALALQGLSTSPYLKDETRDLIKGGFPVEKLPSKVQEYIKNTLERPKTFVDLSGGRPGGEKESKGKKETFNLLKMLLDLLGLPFKFLGLDGNFEESKKAQEQYAQPGKNMYNVKQVMRNRL